MSGTKVYEPASGTVVDTLDIAYGAGDTRERQVAAIGDSTTPGSVARVETTKATDADAALVTRSATLERRFGYAGTLKKPMAGSLNTSGDNTFLTPTTGKRLRVLWVSVQPSSDNTAANLVTVKWPTTTPANLYCAYVIGHWEVFEGGVNESLVVNLANAQPVAVTVHYEEF